MKRDTAGSRHHAEGLTHIYIATLTYIHEHTHKRNADGGTGQAGAHA